jgi:hypothetical protein
MIDAWREAGLDLRIDVIAPGEVAGIDCAAHLPQFGGSLGMLVLDPAATLFEEASAFRQEHPGYAFPFVRWTSYERQRFVNALVDWTWQAPGQRRSGLPRHPTADARGPRRTARRVAERRLGIVPDPFGDAHGRSVLADR